MRTDFVIVLASTRLGTSPIVVERPEEPPCQSMVSENRPMDGGEASQGGDKGKVRIALHQTMR